MQRKRAAAERGPAAELGFIFVRVPYRASASRSLDGMAQEVQTTCTILVGRAVVLPRRHTDGTQYASIKYEHVLYFVRILAGSAFSFLSLGPYLQKIMRLWSHRASLNGHLYM